MLNAHKFSFFTLFLFFFLIYMLFKSATFLGNCIFCAFYFIPIVLFFFHSLSLFLSFSISMIRLLCIVHLCHAHECLMLTYKMVQHFFYAGSYFLCFCSPLWYCIWIYQQYQHKIETNWIKKKLKMFYLVLHVDQIKNFCMLKLGELKGPIKKNIFEIQLLTKYEIFFYCLIYLEFCDWVIWWCQFKKMKLSKSTVIIQKKTWLNQSAKNRFDYFLIDSLNELNNVDLTRFYWYNSHKLLNRLIILCAFTK